ncbi:hypothetical protein EW145_g7377, partial [Phellinidium pouzarii]
MSSPLRIIHTILVTDTDAPAPSTLFDTPQDWPRHRLECKPTENPIIVQPTPEVKTVLAILFDPKKDDLEFISVELKPPTWIPDFNNLHKSFIKGIPIACVNTGTILHHLQIICYQNASQLQSGDNKEDKNKAIQSLTKSKPDAQPWYGPIVVFKLNNANPPSYLDANS